MKKLLILLVLFTTGIQTIRAQSPCGGSLYEMRPTADIKVSYANEPPYFNYGTTACIKKQLGTPDGSLWIGGSFDKVAQLDGNDSGIVQILPAKDIAKRDLNGTWSTTPLPLGTTSIGNIWFLHSSIYATMDVSGGIRKYDSTTSTWSQPMLPGLGVQGIIPTGNPYEYYVSCSATPLNVTMTGLWIWNIQTNTVIPMANSTLPDMSSGYYLNEGNQTGDTVFVKFHDLSSSQRVLIKNNPSVLDFADIGMTDPKYGSPNFYNGNVTFSYCLDVIKTPNNRIFTSVGSYGAQVTALLEWNYSSQEWDSVTSIIGVGGSYPENPTVFWYDPQQNKLHSNSLGIVDFQTNEFTPVHAMMSSPPWTALPYRVASFSHGGTYYAWPGAKLKDITAPSAPNTTTPSGIVSIIGEQYVPFTGDNAHDGYLATMYDCCGNVLHTLPIDGTNCANFVFNHLVPLGTNDYYFSLTDTSGNESSKTHITVVASWPTNTNDVDQNFASVYTDGKTITITGDIINVQLYSLTGQVIFSSKINSQKFTQSFEYLSNGLYFLKASNAQGKIMKETVILR